MDTAEVAWRTAAAELDVGKKPGVLVLTIHCAFTLLSWSLASYFLVGNSPAWTLAFRRRRRGTQVLLFPQKVAESLQAHHAVHVNWLRLPLPLRLLCFGILWVCGTWRSFTASTVGPTFLEVMSASLCLGGYGGRLWPRVSTRRASSPCLPCSSRASFSFAGWQHNVTHKLTKTKWAAFVKRCLEARTNIPQMCTHPKQNVPQEHREGGASHG